MLVLVGRAILPSARLLVAAECLAIGAAFLACVATVLLARRRIGICRARRQKLRHCIVAVRPLPGDSSIELGQVVRRKGAWAREDQRFDLKPQHGAMSIHSGSGVSEQNVCVGTPKMTRSQTELSISISPCSVASKSLSHQLSLPGLLTQKIENLPGYMTEAAELGQRVGEKIDNLPGCIAEAAELQQRVGELRRVREAAMRTRAALRLELEKLNGTASPNAEGVVALATP